MINKKSKNIIYVFLFIFLFSCSSSDKFAPVASESELAKNFDIPDAEASKYQVNEVDAYEREIIQAPKLEIKDEEIEKKNVSKTTKKNKTSKVKVKVESKSEDKVEAESKFIYPEDYPELLKSYDKKSKDVWALSNPIYIEGEKFYFDAKYVGILAGHVVIETKPLVKINGKIAFHYFTKLTSAKYYSFIYDLNDYIDSYVAKDSFLPIKYTLIQRESKQSVDDLQVFDHEKRQTHSFYKRIKNEQESSKKLTAYLPEYFQDSFSALMFARSLPMTIGKVYEFPVITRGKVWLLKFSAHAKETIKINGEYIAAIKVNAETHFPGVLKKRGDIFFWYSDDKYRKLLKFNAKVKIGSVEGELKKYENPLIPNDTK